MIGGFTCFGKTLFMNTFYLDTETTGLHPATDELVEIAVVDDAGNIVLDTLLRPAESTAWPDAQRIHGISPDDVAMAPTREDVLPELLALVTGARLVIYNADFDLGFLPEVATAADQVSCCMLDFAEHIGDWNDYRWHKLDSAANYVGFHWPGSKHRAAADALACRAVWQYLRRQDDQP